MVLAVFQSFMPLLGWFEGMQIAEYISNTDHWIASGLLSTVGVKMIIGIIPFLAGMTGMLIEKVLAESPGKKLKFLEDKYYLELD